MASNVSRSKTMPAFDMELASTVDIFVNLLVPIVMLREPPLIVAPATVTP